jgi:hypothetical protein
MSDKNIPLNFHFKRGLGIHLDLNLCILPCNHKKIYGGSSKQWINFKPYLKGAFDEIITN